ncbi:MAG: hypothetical protein KME26_31835 [Oscillatoria princeps RMCB-10]|nr:hypothetical protein [Oscillatoria princeps RMCB-10]
MKKAERASNEAEFEENKAALYLNGNVQPPESEWAVSLSQAITTKVTAFWGCGRDHCHSWADNGHSNGNERLLRRNRRNKLWNLS